MIKVFTHSDTNKPNTPEIISSTFNELNSKIYDTTPIIVVPEYYGDARTAKKMVDKLGGYEDVLKGEGMTYYGYKVYLD